MGLNPLGSQIGTDLTITDGDLTTNVAVQQHVLGARATTGDGRYFRYVKAGAVALVPGNLQQCAAETTAWEDLDFASAAIGDLSLTTVSTVTLTENQLAEGYAIVTTGTGAGYQYKIKSNPAVIGAVVKIQLYDAIQVATPSGGDIDLIPSPYSGVIINPSSATGMPVGVAVFPVTALYFGWIQTAGAATIFSDGGSTVGTNVSASNGTPGAVEAEVTAQASVGVAMTGVTTAEYGLFMLNLS